MGGKRVATVGYFWMTWVPRFLICLFKFQQVAYFEEGFSVFLGTQSQTPLSQFSK